MCEALGLIPTPKKKKTKKKKNKNKKNKSLKEGGKKSPVLEQ
jgi:hypothetical protein